MLQAKKAVKRENTLRSKVWLYPGMAGWHFISVSKKASGEIKTTFGKHVRGWGSIPVSVTIGNTWWNTSIFPDSKSGTYLLPLNAKVRKQEGISANDTVQFFLKIR